MEFPGVSKKSMWNFQELIKSRLEFPRMTVTKKNFFSGISQHIQCLMQEIESHFQ